jgi:exonuclease VII large subunit
VLARGYSITRNAAGQIVRDARTLAPGDGIHVDFITAAWTPR